MNKPREGKKNRNEMERRAYHTHLFKKKGRSVLSPKPASYKRGKKKGKEIPTRIVPGEEKGDTKYPACSGECLSLWVEETSVHEEENIKKKKLRSESITTSTSQRGADHTFY